MPYRALRSVGIANFHDNSGDSPRIILVANAGFAARRAQPTPQWVGL
jgi:hypothetical protein